MSTYSTISLTPLRLSGLHSLTATSGISLLWSPFMKADWIAVIMGPPKRRRVADSTEEDSSDNICQPATHQDKEKWNGFCEIESEPVFFIWSHLWWALTHWLIFFHRLCSMWCSETLVSKGSKFKRWFLSMKNWWHLWSETHIFSTIWGNWRTENWLLTF